MQKRKEESYSAWLGLYNAVAGLEAKSGQDDNDSDKNQENQKTEDKESSKNESGTKSETAGTVTFTKAKNTKNVTVPATMKLAKNAFAKSKVKTVVLKTKSLKKSSVKGSLKGSKVTKIQVKAGSKKVNKKLVKKYKKIFTKKNAGKKVIVK